MTNIVLYFWYTTLYVAHKPIYEKLLSTLSSNEAVAIVHSSFHVQLIHKSTSGNSYYYNLALEHHSQAFTCHLLALAFRFHRATLLFSPSILGTYMRCSITIFTF